VYVESDDEFGDETGEMLVGNMGVWIELEEGVEGEFVEGEVLVEERVEVAGVVQSAGLHVGH
jgi:hypothetical protein